MIGAEHEDVDGTVADVAQCPVSTKEEPQSADPPGCAAVSEDEFSVDKASLEERYHLNIIPNEALPDSSKWEREKSSTTPRSEGEMVWDASIARDSQEQVELLEAIVPRDRREAALALLHGNGYQINGILGKVMQKEPANGLHWSPAAKKEFSQYMLNTRTKDFAELGRLLKKEAGDCQAYYYSHFKNTAEYKTMKRAGKRQMTTRSSGDGTISPSEEASLRLFTDECSKCDDDDGEMQFSNLIRMFHMRCVGLESAPDETWFCEEC